MKVKRVSIIVAILLGLFSLKFAIGHPGRTDKNGGHYNRKTGEYHYHSTPKSSSSIDSETLSESVDLLPKSMYVVRVINGNTIELTNQMQVQYIGIDVPDIGELGAQDAKEANKTLVEGKKIKLEYDTQKRDKYGRVLAYVYLEKSIFVNAELIKQGYAQIITSPPNIKHAKLFQTLQKQAQEEKRGLWGIEAFEKVNQLDTSNTDDDKKLTKEVAIPLLIPSEDFSNETAYPVLRTIDGDTVEIQYSGKPTVVRFTGVDTPETVHPQKAVEVFGKEASEFTHNLLLGEEVYLRFDTDKTDKYGRMLAYLYRAPDGLFVNLEIVRQGYGHAYTQFPFKHMELFRYYEQRAREAGKGLWSNTAVSITTEAIKSADKVEKAETEQPSNQNQRDIVYITKTGSKYHRAGCRYLSKSAIPITRQEAIAKGYTPCSVCKP
jgi:micrococcal nuclease